MRPVAPWPLDTTAACTGSINLSTTPLTPPDSTEAPFAPRKQPSKNDIFNSPPSSICPPARLNTASAPVTPANTWKQSHRKHTRNSSLGRASSEERIREEARIRSARDVNFRLCPSREYILGEGRHCTVFVGSVWDGHSWRLCAVKRLHADRQSQLLGLDEAFALRRLGRHRRIIELIDIRDEVELVMQRSAVERQGLETDPPRLLIFLELLPTNLAVYAETHSFGYDQWLQWAAQMAEAVEFLHSKGCVHADIKKENMLLEERTLNIKLCDFNSAVFPITGDPPRDGLGLGTLAYSAPELSWATGGPRATSFSYPIDIFSMGAVLYSLATGWEPFSNRSVVEVLHRKGAFFENEEAARVSRLKTSKGRPGTPGTSGPSSVALARLLEPIDARGVLPTGGATPIPMPPSANMRAVAMQSTRSLESPYRPDPLRRRSSCGDEKRRSTRGDTGSPYADGRPAIMFNGGGRLPDQARDLVRSMVAGEAAARPLAVEVVRAVDALIG